MDPTILYRRQDGVIATATMIQAGIYGAQFPAQPKTLSSSEHPDQYGPTQHPTQ